MNLSTFVKALHPVDRESLTAVARSVRKSDAWLAGGTGLFAEPQPQIRRLVDLMGMNWQPLTESDQGLLVAATCKLGTLASFRARPAWQAASLISQCCKAFPLAFKSWDLATVGGNLCSALPAGPMITLCTALDALCTIWTPAGGERRLSLTDFILGQRLTALRPGEVLRSVMIPAEALTRTTASRRVSLTHSGFSNAFLVGTLSERGDFALTVTASTRRPFLFGFEGMPSESQLREKLAEAISWDDYYFDIHERPDWCREKTLDIGAEIRAELCGALPLRKFLAGATHSGRRGENGNSEGVALR